ncbi:O-antigen ligase like membrane protein [Sulfitobacter marinus]|uniref:O-antigen ligase like membrane protein n=1 Tax=Sulfitobacter marinus TaxID=394264 RepID=A0A1I6VBR1_9RHOB|nr:O-antigen ligase family protein [Sulfitobacter marinus]SFT11151.1 O-antigen ligase like membrane protein [Sulfitobacter marinus]
MSIADSEFSRNFNGLYDPDLRRRSSVGVVIGIFLLLILLPIGVNIGPLYLSGTRLFLIVVIIPLAVNLIRGRYGPFIATDVLFALHFIWMSLALGVNNPDQAVQNAGATGADFLGSYLLGRACIRTRDDFLTLIRAIVALIIICLPFAVIEAVTGISPLIEMAGRIPFVSAPLDLSIDRRLGLERVQMGFEHPIHWGVFCSVGTAICLVGLQATLTFFSRVLLTVLICLSALLALSSGAILSVAVQIGLILWAAVFRSNPKRWLILLVVMTLCYGAVDLLSNRTPLRVFMSYATFSADSAYWRATIFEWGMVNVWAQPMWGLGLNDWVRPIWMHTASIDNFWLLSAMRYGIPGFAFLAGGYGYAVWRIGMRSLREDDALWPLRRAWVFCFVGLTLALATVHVWGTLHALVFFLFGSGMWLFPHKVAAVRQPKIWYVPERRLPKFSRANPVQYTQSLSVDYAGAEGHEMPARPGTLSS